MAFESIVQGGAQQSQPYGCTAWGLANRSEWNCPGRGCSGYGFHAGIDLWSAKDTPLLAVGYGVRVHIPRPPGSCGGLGPYAVCIRSGPIDVWYGHCSQDLVPIGAAVQPGQPVARMGSLGCSTGTHVHYEVQPAGSVNGCQSLDPNPYIGRWPGAPPTPPPGPPPPDPGRGAPLLLLAAGGAALAAYGLSRGRPQS